jgi:putative hydrolase of the HAD superfamily
MTIRAVVFDFGNVLGSFDRRRAAANLAALGPADLDPAVILELLHHSGYEVAYETAQIGTAEILRLMRERFGLVADDEAIAFAFADMFTPNQDVCSLVPHLAGRYHLAMLSNTNEMHYRHFRREFASVLDRFDHLVASHEVGLRKPDPAIYQLVQERAGCAAEQIVFVDDLEANLVAARALGWRTIPYHKDVDLARSLAEHGVDIPPTLG